MASLRKQSAAKSKAGPRNGSLGASWDVNDDANSLGEQYRHAPPNTDGDVFGDKIKNLEKEARHQTKRANKDEKLLKMQKKMFDQHVQR